MPRPKKSPAGLSAGLECPLTTEKVVIVIMSFRPFTAGQILAWAVRQVFTLGAHEVVGGRFLLGAGVGANSVQASMRCTGTARRNPVR